MKRRFFISLILFMVFVSGVFLYHYFNSSLRPDFEWTMVNVNHSIQQGDAHLIRTRNGKTMLIDAGHQSPAEKSLLPLIEEESIKKIDLVFISHPHKDHYDGLNVLLDNNIKLDEVYFNVPNKEICDMEIPWGCNYSEIQTLHEKLKSSGAAIKAAEAGQSFKIGRHTHIKVLYAFDGVNTPVGRTDVNDLSLIMMLYHKQFKFLFTGDLNWKVGEYLAESSSDLSADILKVPHHGTEVTAPDSFFIKASSRYALIPTTRKLWLSDRSARIRNWFSTNKVPVYVNGINGDVRVVVENGTLMIFPEKLARTNDRKIKQADLFQND